MKDEYNGLLSDFMCQKYCRKVVSKYSVMCHVKYFFPSFTSYLETIAATLLDVDNCVFGLYL